MVIEIATIVVTILVVGLSLPKCQYNFLTRFAGTCILGSLIALGVMKLDGALDAEVAYNLMWVIGSGFICTAAAAYIKIKNGR